MLTGYERGIKTTVKYYLLKKSSGRLDQWTFVFQVPKDEINVTYLDAIKGNLFKYSYSDSIEKIFRFQLKFIYTQTMYRLSRHKHLGLYDNYIFYYE